MPAWSSKLILAAARDTRAYLPSCSGLVVVVVVIFLNDNAERTGRRSRLLDATSSAPTSTEMLSITTTTTDRPRGAKHDASFGAAAREKKARMLWIDSF
jgi:hypothetical protein